AEDGIRDFHVTGVQTCALPIYLLAGAEVGIQVLVPVMNGIAGAQIGVDVGPAEGVDGLLGITDQQQGAVRIVESYPIDAVEDTRSEERRVVKDSDCGRWYVSER